MTGTDTTVQQIVQASSWDQRVAQIRLIPQKHGTGEHQRIYAEVARQTYVQHLAPDFAYIHKAPFYEERYFGQIYAAADEGTAGFTDVAEDRLAQGIHDEPRTLLVFRTIMGLTREEFAHSTKLAGPPRGFKPLSPGKIESMERDGTATSGEQPG